MVVANSGTNGGNLECFGCIPDCADCLHMKSGRCKLGLFMTGSFIWIVAEVWRRCGKDVGVVLRASSKRTVLKMKQEE